MKREEIDILGIKKRKEGKSYDQIRKEIKNINSFSRETKTDRQIIEKQSKKIEKLQTELEKEKKKVFNLKLENSTSGREEEKNTKNITLNDLKKIICLILSEEKEISKKEIVSTCYLTEKKVDCAITFLKRHKIIKESSRNGIRYYRK